MSEPIRLQKYIASCGVASRRAAEEMILRGQVSVDGITITELGFKVDPRNCHVLVDGKPISLKQQQVYILLNKPRGYVTTVKDNFSRKTVLDLLPPNLPRVYPVGRLDYDSEGLLLLTNDGDLTFQLTHPRHSIAKSYLVKVRGTPDEKALNALRTGVLIDGIKTRPAKATLKRAGENSAILLITIYEGRNRQVRKMCASVGHEVLALRRIAEGPLRLGDLPTGSHRHLTLEEIKALKGNQHADN